jgi:nitroreductase
LSAVVKELTGRRALRGLADRSLDQAVVRRIFEAASLAPSAANKQPWRFVAVQSQPLLDNLRSTLTEGNYWAKKAPLLVAAWTHVDYDLSTPDGRQFALFDLGQAVMALQVQAQAEGLVTHPFAGFDTVKAAQILELPAGAQLPVLITVSHLGTSDHLSDKHKEAETAPRTRKALEEVVNFR